MIMKTFATILALAATLVAQAASAAYVQLPVPVNSGGTGATTATTARTDLGVTATGQDTTYAYRADNLSDLASESTARTNLGVTATGQDTTYAYRANNLGDLANAATARSNLGLTIGSNVEAWSAGLDSLGGLSTTGKLYYLSGVGAWSPVAIGANLTFSSGTLAAANSGCSGSCSFSGSNQLGSANSNIQTIQGHLVAIGGTPTGTCNSIAGNDIRGTAAFPSAGSCTIIFSTPYGATPVCWPILSQTGGPTGLYISALTANGFTLNASASNTQTVGFGCLG